MTCAAETIYGFVKQYWFWA